MKMCTGCQYLKIITQRVGLINKIRYICTNKSGISTPLVENISGVPKSSQCPISKDKICD